MISDLNQLQTLTIELSVASSQEDASDCCLVQLSEEPSHIDMHQTPLIVKRVKYIARFNDIDGIYHVMPIPQFIARWVGVLRMAIKGACAPHTIFTL